MNANITKRGAKVIWAEDAQASIGSNWKICAEKNCKTLVKSKSMVTEEIHLNDFLEKNGIESVETDLGRIYSAVGWRTTLSYRNTSHA